ncbi:MAG: glucose-6-phosphate isomerase [Bifidobacteriaceae bacterium]|jgi:glucose-6-phosphate isomerase|nr:glucose-6-phosphate isomerase [Bifidobacteriaceae bacterium]
MRTVDSAAYKVLVQHKDALAKEGVDLRKWFADDAERATKMTFRAGDLLIDLSKNLVTDETLDRLVDLANAVDLKGKIDAEFRGDKINVTENRSVLHTVLRRSKEDSLTVDGVDVVKDVHEVLERMYKCADKIRSGVWLGVTGKKIKTVVNIGIGGSDLGPFMAYEALKAHKDPEVEGRFVSNVDPDDLAEKVFNLDPETTLFIIASKTFTTQETMANAHAAKEWFLRELEARYVANTADEQELAIKKHFVAVSTALDEVAKFGIDTDNAFGFWNWVGGRYSVDSAIGLSLILAYGPRVFQEFLLGFRTIDKYFSTTDFRENGIVLMALINVWNRNFFKFATHAVLPYSEYLHRFPAYLQQLTMESNGKGVKHNGEQVDLETGEVFFGEPGTNGQHAFYQLIHQGTEIVPADFIAFAKGKHDIKTGGTSMHAILLANFFAQTKALAFGKTRAEVEAEGTPENIVPARIFTGNRPTTSIMASELTPSVLGQLIALYEHITFVCGVIWEIDSFDQWGVELGKKLAKELQPAVDGDANSLNLADSSTQSLIKFYRENR